MARGFWLFCLMGFLYYKGFELLFTAWVQEIRFEKLVVIFLLPPVVVGTILAIRWVRSLKVPEFKMPEPAASPAVAAGNEHWSEDS